MLLPFRLFFECSFLMTGLRVCPLELGLAGMSSSSSQSASSAVQFCDADDVLLCRFLLDSDAALADIND